MNINDKIAFLSNSTQTRDEISMVPEEINKIIGSRIRILRRLADMTQRELGDQLGVCFQQIQHYEKGRHTIDIKKLIAIANFFHRDISFFFSGSIEKDPTKQ